MIPPLKYDKDCNRTNCPDPPTHHVAIECKGAKVYFNLVVCDAHAPEVTVDHLVPRDRLVEFEKLMGIQTTEPWDWEDLKVILEPLEGP